MFEAQRLEFCLESLVLACLASVVLLLEDTLTRSYARREVTATLITVYVELAYHRVTITLRTLHLLTRPVRRRMPREELDRQILIARTLLLSQLR